MAFGLQDIGNLMNNDIGITSLQELTLDSFFGVILMIAYFIVLIALFIVLLMRALMIWLIIAFSPLWALHFVIGDKISFGDKLPIKILHEIFVPVLVAVPLVVGYLMILVGQGVTSGKDGQAIVHNEAVMGGYSLMWKIAAIVILWKGVFAAMDETLAGDVVDKLEKGTERVGKFALKAFRYAPIFPTKVDLDGKD